MSLSDVTGRLVSVQASFSVSLAVTGSLALSLVDVAAMPGSS